MLVHIKFWILCLFWHLRDLKIQFKEILLLQSYNGQKSIKSQYYVRGKERNLDVKWIHMKINILRPNLLLSNITDSNKSSNRQVNTDLADYFNNTLKPLYKLWITSWLIVFKILIKNVVVVFIGLSILNNLVISKKSEYFV